MVVVDPLGGHLPARRGNVALDVTPVVFLEPAGHAISPKTTQQDIRDVLALTIAPKGKR